MCLAMIGPGDTAIVPAPCYPIHLYAVALASGNVLSLEIADPAKYLSNIAHAAEHFIPRPKLVIANFPHNPTTKVVERDFYVELVRLAKRYSFHVLSDLAYADVCFDDYEAPSFLSVPGAKDVGVEFTTMSKGYNMAGWRLGFCCGHAEMVRALATIKGYYDYGIFTPIQIAGIIALRHCEDAVESQRLVYQRRRDVHAQCGEDTSEWIRYRTHHNRGLYIDAGRPCCIDLGAVTSDFWIARYNKLPNHSLRWLCIQLG